MTPSVSILTGLERPVQREEKAKGDIRWLLFQSSPALKDRCNGPREAPESALPELKFIFQSWPGDSSVRRRFLQCDDLAERGKPASPARTSFVRRRHL